MPVSYTHLDVYKRQPYYNIPDSDSYIYVVFEQETGYMVSNCAKLQWEPVSYTHLDVYKRQERESAEHMWIM